MLSRFQQGDDPLADHGLYDCVVYRCVVGSRAYGLDHDGSATTTAGASTCPPADRQWSLWGVPDQLDHPTRDEVYWELQKFVTLALRANPNILECLFTPLVEVATPVAQELLSMRAAFVSKLVYQTYNGYVASQFKKMQADVRNKGSGPSPSTSCTCCDCCWPASRRCGPGPGAGPRRPAPGPAAGRPPGPVGELAEVEAWRADLHRQFDAAYEATALPDRPDYAAANAFLVRARRSVV